MPLTLLYHDVTVERQDDASGFPGAGAARYKLTREQFTAHMASIAGSVTSPAAGCGAFAWDAGSGPAWLLTFDDGGISAYTEIAHVLERYGWIGHFFVTADRINTPGFLSREQVRALSERGHVIGSHSCTHPPRMSACSWEQLVDEWQRSRRILERVLEREVRVASIPGGYYSAAVAQAAAQAGIRVLFTSEPTPRPWVVDGCLVLGRYSVIRGTSPVTAAAIAAGRVLPRVTQAVMWNTKKIAKAAGGTAYLSVRNRILSRFWHAPGPGTNRAATA